MFNYLREKKTGKIIVIIMIVINIILTDMPISDAAQATQADLGRLLAIHKQPKWSLDELNSRIQEIHILTGLPEKNLNNQWINPFVFEHYGKKVICPQKWSSAPSLCTLTSL